MIIIVTGGRGFIGHHLIDKLLVDEHSVFVIDNEIADPVDIKHGKATYFKACCSQISNLNVKADIVFHLGEYSRVEPSFKNSHKCLTNTISTIPYILDYCKSSNAKLIYAGSSTKFSDTKSPYSVCKSLNTELIKWYCKAFNIDFAICYFYNAYGNKERNEGEFSTVVSKFIKIKSNNGTALIHGDGNQVRCFTHVDDICKGLLLVAKYGLGDCFGIGSDEKISINELANIIGVNYKYVTDKKGNRQDAPLKTERTKALGWASTKNIRNYINNKQ